MNEVATDTYCSNCKEPINTALDIAGINAACVKCGATARTIDVSISESLIIRHGIGLKARRPSQKKHYIEELSMPSFSIKLEKYVHHNRVIDRDNDHYMEKVTDYETGEIIHHCEEPLSEHRGHGAAKSSNKL